MTDVQRVFAERVKKGAHIKLLGDSITHGVGGTGFIQNGEHIVTDYSRNPDGYCWANRFASYIAEKYGATVTKEYVKGRQNLVANPAITEYNKTATAANGTVSTLINIVKSLSEEAGGSKLQDLISGLDV